MHSVFRYWLPVFDSKGLDWPTAIVGNPTANVIFSCCLEMFSILNSILNPLPQEMHCDDRRHSGVASSAPYCVAVGTFRER